MPETSPSIRSRPLARRGPRSPGGDERFPRGRGRELPRQREEQPLAELIGRVFAKHKLTEAVRRHRVLVFWRDIVGERIASRTTPDWLARGVLRVLATTSSWVHELSFHRAQLIEQIARWSGETPLVEELRVSLGTQRDVKRTLDGLDAEAVRSHVVRADNAPPTRVSDADRAAICAQTSAVEDDELRALIEQVRLRWNR